MISMTKSLAVGFGLMLLNVFGAHADGVYPMFAADGGYIDDIEIIGDVTLPSGEVLAALEMRNQYLKFFVDPDGIYVTMLEDNPILTQQKPFYGYWVSTQSVDIADWPACDYEVSDEFGTPYLAHGTLVWTNTAIADNGYELAFNIDLGTCNTDQTPWAYSRAAIEMSGLSGVPHDDIDYGDDYILTDANGVEFLVDITDYGATLISVDPREIVIPLATAEPSNETLFEQEILEMYMDCSTSSIHHGYGTWSWANGGFFVDFEAVSFSFPRLDAPVNDDTGACRL